MVNKAVSCSNNESWDALAALWPFDWSWVIVCCRYRAAGGYVHEWKHAVHSAVTSHLRLPVSQTKWGSEQQHLEQTGEQIEGRIRSHSLRVWTTPQLKPQPSVLTFYPKGLLSHRNTSEQFHMTFEKKLCLIQRAFCLIGFTKITLFVHKGNHHDDTCLNTACFIITRHCRTQCVDQTCRHLSLQQCLYSSLWITFWFKLSQI